MFKIFNTETHLYSDGGKYYVSFSTAGKTWNKLVDVKLHLKQIPKKQLESTYKDCILIEYTPSINGDMLTVSRVPVVSFSSHHKVI